MHINYIPPQYGHHQKLKKRIFPVIVNEDGHVLFVEEKLSLRSEKLLRDYDMHRLIDWSLPCWEMLEDGSPKQFLHKTLKRYRFLKGYSVENQVCRALRDSDFDQTSFMESYYLVRVKSRRRIRHATIDGGVYRLRYFSPNEIERYAEKYQQIFYPISAGIWLEDVVQGRVEKKPINLNMMEPANFESYFSGKIVKEQHHGKEIRLIAGQVH